MNKKVFGAVCLFLAALIWGIAFVAQDRAAVWVEGFTFQATRSALAAVVLLGIVAGRRLARRKRGVEREVSEAGESTKKWLFLGGIGCGVLLFAAAGLQQFGIANNVTSPGKDAFITALYIVFVPVLGLFLGRRSQPHVYVCVAVALVGLWMLCMGGSGLSTGDIQVILCSVCFSFHIMLVDLVAPRVDGIALSCVQFFVVAALSAVGMLLFEEPSWQNITAAIWPILYTGILSAAGGYTLQIIGQKHTSPTVACLLMSLESVFAVLTAMILLPEVPAPTAREWIGMVLIFVAIVAAQLTFGKKTKQA